MSTESVPTSPQGIAVTFPPEAYSRIVDEAKRYGLSPQAYLTAVSAVQAGRVSPDTLRAIGELYRHDRDTLNELSK